MDCRGSMPVDGESQAAVTATRYRQFSNETVANLDKNFAGIQIIRSAKGEAVLTTSGLPRERLTTCSPQRRKRLSRKMFCRILPITDLMGCPSHPACGGDYRATDKPHPEY